MALDLRQQLKLAQQLVITPQLQQAIKLLQLSRMELQDVIQQELTENPLLEQVDPVEEEQKVEEAQQSHGEEVEAAKEADHGHEHEMDEVGTKEGAMKEPSDFDWDNYLGTYNTPWPTTGPPPAAEGPTYENSIRSTETLQQHLLWQLHMSNFDAATVQIGTEIVGNITDDGYLAAMIEDLAAKCQTNTETIDTVLRKIQLFDPPGVGARDLQECLRLQARQLSSADTPLLIRVIDEHMKELERHHFSQIAKKLRITVEHARALAQTIQEMEPKPGRPFVADHTQYITPDVYVYKTTDDYLIILNDDGLPRLQISNFYRRTLQNGGTVQADTKEYMQGKLRSALWLIKSIHQRQQTLYKVTKSIVKFQRDFLDHGIDSLKPMILRDVAEDIGMHESTVSRVTTNKFVHTPRGIFELKYFFNSGVHKSEGEDVAAETVKQKIAQLIAAENPQRPFSDQHIAQLLKKDRIVIARRTVAKYRENLSIPPSSQRRRME